MWMVFDCNRTFTLHGIRTLWSSPPCSILNNINTLEIRPPFQQTHLPQVSAHLTHTDHHTASAIQYLSCVGWQTDQTVWSTAVPPGAYSDPAGQWTWDDEVWIPMRCSFLTAPFCELQPNCDKQKLFLTIWNWTSCKCINSHLHILMMLCCG